MEPMADKALELRSNKFPEQVDFLSADCARLRRIKLTGYPAHSLFHMPKRMHMGLCDQLALISKFIFYMLKLTIVGI